MNKSKLHKSDGISPLNQWEMCHLLQQGQNYTLKMQATVLLARMGITSFTTSVRMSCAYLHNYTFHMRYSSLKILIF